MRYFCFVSDHAILEQSKHKAKPITEYGSVGIVVFVSFNVNALFSISHLTLVPNPSVSWACVADVKRGGGGGEGKTRNPLSLSLAFRRLSRRLQFPCFGTHNILVDFFSFLFCLFRDFKFSFSLLQLHLLFADDFLIFFDRRKNHVQLNKVIQKESILFTNRCLFTRFLTHDSEDRSCLYVCLLTVAMAASKPSVFHTKLNPVYNEKNTNRAL